MILFLLNQLTFCKTSAKERERKKMYQLPLVSLFSFREFFRFTKTMSKIQKKKIRIPLHGKFAFCHLPLNPQKEEGGEWGRATPQRQHNLPCRPPPSPHQHHVPPTQAKTNTNCQHSVDLKEKSKTVQF